MSAHRVKRCNCWICKRGRAITKIVNGRSPVAMRKLIRQMEEWLLTAEESANWHECEAREAKALFDPSGGER